MKTLSIEDVVAAIQVERKYQDDKWGRLDEQNGRDPIAWVNTLKEEVDEVEDADFRNNTEEFVLELVQVAAVAVAALQQLGPLGLKELVQMHRGVR